MLKFPEPTKPWLMPIGVDPETRVYLMNTTITAAWHEGSERGKIIEYALRHNCRYIRDIDGYTVYDAADCPVHEYEAAMKKYEALLDQANAAKKEAERLWKAMVKYLDEKAAADEAPKRTTRQAGGYCYDPNEAADEAAKRG